VTVRFHISSNDDWTILTTTSGSHHFDKAPLTQLRSIKFVLDPGRINRNRWVTQILSCIASAPLEDVTLELVFPRGKGFTSDNVSTALEWKAVDAVLQRSTFSSLRNVQISCNLPWVIVDSTSDLAQLHRIIMEGLPYCHARGIVRVDQW
jgi:hypothetical protein